MIIMNICKAKYTFCKYVQGAESVKQKVNRKEFIDINKTMLGESGVFHYEGLDHCYNPDKIQHIPCCVNWAFDQTWH